MKVAADLDIHRFIYQTGAQLAETREPEKVLRTFLREVAGHLGSERAVIAVLEPGMSGAEIRFAHPEDAACDLATVTALLRGDRRPVPPGMVVARLRRRQRPWGMVVLEGAEGAFPEGAPRALALVAEAMSERIERIDRLRLSEVRARIDDKMMRELPPKDVYYQILDGIHQLTRYDHSSQLWIWDPGPGDLVMVAEQIAYEKGKSGLIGTRVALDVDQQALLCEGGIYGYDHAGAEWREWTGLGAVPLATLLDSSGRGAPPRPAEGAMLCAALGTRDGRLGVLKVSELHAGSFADWERAVVGRFALLASLALQRAMTIEILQARMLKAESQTVLAQLARGVAHDVNNALGEVLTLVQQLRFDLAEGRLDPAAMAEDLERIESGIHLTRGIFGRMMRFARARGGGPPDRGDAVRAVSNTVELMRDSLGKLGVRLELSAADDLPAVRCGTGDLERLLLNLMSNARDAMPAGGTLTVAIRRDDSNLVFLVADTGAGMSAEILKQIERPFFTTKEHGTGLGLSTCRSIAAEVGGSLRIESTPGEGTRVTVRIPVQVESE